MFDPKSRVTCFLACALLAAMLNGSPASAVESEGSQEETAKETRSSALRIADKTFDVLFLRTSGFLVFCTGAGMFVPAAWVTVPGGEEAIAQARETFVERAGRYVFTRPLGDF